MILNCKLTKISPEKSECCPTTPPDSEVTYESMWMESRLRRSAHVVDLAYFTAPVCFPSKPWQIIFGMKQRPWQCWFQRCPGLVLKSLAKFFMDVNTLFELSL